MSKETHTRLSIVIPCFNEEKTLELCLQNVLGIQDESLILEIIVVDDCSTDNSLKIAEAISEKHAEVIVLHHDRNQGKGAALQTGFQHATGRIVAVQDADLEYEPADLKRMVTPILNDKADVVIGSRFASGGTHRVLYFWHYLGNKFLTLLSNMFSDLNLTDMECCYKVFRRDIIQKINIRESRFGVEPELVAKVAQMRARIYEMGVSYAGRTYGEGKKIGYRDGFRALYCIFHYNARTAPVPVQFLIYILIGGLSALANISLFLLLMHLGLVDNLSVPAAFVSAAVMNYLLCITFLFRHKAKWKTAGEVLIYFILVCLVGTIDFGATKIMLNLDTAPWLAKSVGCLVGLGFNFLGRRYFVFPEPSPGPWRSQMPDSDRLL
ncbi:MAG: glycosyltransferase [bacterium]|nr:glycosyltransferase [bacterium]